MNGLFAAGAGATALKAVKAETQRLGASQFLCLEYVAPDGAGDFMRFYNYNDVAPTALAAGRGPFDGQSASPVRGEISVETNPNPFLAPSGATYCVDRCQKLDAPAASADC